jgi:PAS domain-containing protein
MADPKTAKEQLKQSEEYFRLLVDGVKEYAIYGLDAKGFVTTWNAGAQRIKGYHVEEIVGKHFSCFYTPEDIQAGQPDKALAVAVARPEGWLHLLGQCADDATARSRRQIVWVCKSRPRYNRTKRN